MIVDAITALQAALAVAGFEEPLGIELGPVAFSRLLGELGMTDDGRSVVLSTDNGPIKVRRKRRVADTLTGEDGR